MPNDVVVMTPFRIVLDLVGGGGSLLFEWKGKEAAVHFASGAEAAAVAEILNDHLTDVLDAALRERLPPSGEPVQ